MVILHKWILIQWPKQSTRRPHPCCFFLSIMDVVFDTSDFIQWSLPVNYLLSWRSEKIRGHCDARILGSSWPYVYLLFFSDWLYKHSYFSHSTTWPEVFQNCSAVNCNDRVLREFNAFLHPLVPGKTSRKQIAGGLTNTPHNISKPTQLVQLPRLVTVCWYLMQTDVCRDNRCVENKCFNRRELLVINCLLDKWQSCLHLQQVCTLIPYD